MLSQKVRLSYEGFKESFRGKGLSIFMYFKNYEVIKDSPDMTSKVLTDIC
jgi:hypothetical protein